MSLRVLTWNVWWRFGPDWRARQPVIQRQLDEAAADVVALQECWGTKQTSQAHELGARLGMHAAFVAPALPPPPDPPEHPDQEGVDVGIGLMSRWPIDEARAVPLPARHRDPAPVAMVARLRHPAGGLHVVVACLEWEPAFDADRHAQASAVVELASAGNTSLPVILCGDLNAAPDSPVLAPIRDAFVDTWIAGGGDPDAVTLRSDHPHAPLEATELIDQRIDHIFVRPGVLVERVALIGEPVDGVHPSDHQAVVCDLRRPTRSDGDRA